MNKPLCQSACAYTLASEALYTNKLLQSIGVSRHVHILPQRPRTHHKYPNYWCQSACAPCASEALSYHTSNPGSQKPRHEGDHRPSICPRLCRVPSLRKPNNVKERRCDYSEINKHGMHYLTRIICLNIACR